MFEYSIGRWGDVDFQQACVMKIFPRFWTSLTTRRKVNYESVISRGSSLHLQVSFPAFFVVGDGCPLDLLKDQSLWARDMTTNFIQGEVRKLPCMDSANIPVGNVNLNTFKVIFN